MKIIQIKNSIGSLHSIYDYKSFLVKINAHILFKTRWSVELKVSKLPIESLIKLIN